MASTVLFMGHSQGERIYGFENGIAELDQSEIQLEPYGVKIKHDSSEGNQWFIIPWHRIEEVQYEEPKRSGEAMFAG